MISNAALIAICLFFIIATVCIIVLLSSINKNLNNLMDWYIDDAAVRMQDIINRSKGDKKDVT